jgi:enoyl-CoA hydratase/carnithine racemase
MLPNVHQLRVEQAGGVVTVTIDAQPLNHFTVQLARDLIALAGWLRSHDTARVVLFQSDTAGFFIPHLDLADFGKIALPPAPMLRFGLLAMLACAHLGPPRRWCIQQLLHLLSPHHRALFEIGRVPQLTIAIVEGRIGGIGSEFAMCLDLRFADRDSAVLNQIEAGFGLWPGAGGTQRLALLCGKGPAHEIVASSRDVDAATAERWGYYNRALPRGEVRGHVRQLAARVASLPREGVRGGTAHVRRAVVPHPRALQLEAIAFLGGLLTAPVKRRVATFLARGGQQREGASNLAALIAALDAESEP